MKNNISAILLAGIILSLVPAQSTKAVTPTPPTAAAADDNTYLFSRCRPPATISDDATHTSTSLTIGTSGTSIVHEYKVSGIASSQTYLYEKTEKVTGGGINLIFSNTIDITEKAHIFLDVPSTAASTTEYPFIPSANSIINTRYYIEKGTVVSVGSYDVWINGAAPLFQCQVLAGEIKDSESNVVMFEGKKTGSPVAPPKIALRGSTAPPAGFGRPDARFKLTHVLDRVGLGTDNEVVTYFTYEATISGLGLVETGGTFEEKWKRLAIKVWFDNGMKIRAVDYGSDIANPNDDSNDSTHAPDLWGSAGIVVSDSTLYDKLINYIFNKGDKDTCNEAGNIVSPNTTLEKANWTTVPPQICLNTRGTNIRPGVAATPQSWLALWGAQGNQSSVSNPSGGSNTGLCGKMADAITGGISDRIGAVMKYALCWIISQIYELGDVLFIGGASWLEKSIGLQFSG